MAGHIITADAVWDLAAGETHFARHRFAITVRQFDRTSGFYNDILQYVTSNKYPSLDEVDKIDVIQPELPKIQRVVNFTYPTDP